MAIKSVEEIRQAVCMCAQAYGADRIYLFGSYAQGNPTEASDLDLRIDKGRIRGLELAGLLVALQESLHMPVDLVTTASLDAEFLERIRPQEVLLYDAGR